MMNSIIGHPIRLNNSDARRLAVAILVQAVSDIQRGPEPERQAAQAWLLETGLGWAETLGFGVDPLDGERIIPRIRDHYKPSSTKGKKRGKYRKHSTKNDQQQAG